MNSHSLPELSRPARAAELPLVALPDGPGIVAVKALKPELDSILSHLADELLVNDFPGSTLTRSERELLAATVSAENGCFFCADSHAAHAEATAGADETNMAQLTEAAKACDISSFGPKLRTLGAVAINVSNLLHDYEREQADVQRALAAGATEEDVQLTGLIAAGFAMFNRLVEGFRAPTPPDTRVYEPIAQQIAAYGYSAAPPME